MTTPAELNKILFNQLNNLQNATKDTLETEVKRAESMQLISEQVIKNNTLILDATKLIADHKGMKGDAAEQPKIQ